MKRELSDSTCLTNPHSPIHSVTSENINQINTMMDTSNDNHDIAATTQTSNPSLSLFSVHMIFDKGFANLYAHGKFAEAAVCFDEILKVIPDHIEGMCVIHTSFCHLTLYLF